AKNHAARARSARGARSEPGLLGGGLALEVGEDLRDVGALELGRELLPLLLADRLQDGVALREDAVDDEDRRPRAEREVDGVARTRVERDLLAAAHEVEPRVERALLHVADDGAPQAGAERAEGAVEEVVRQRPRRRDARDVARDRVSIGERREDGQEARAL